jgi:hypothetical protein
MNFGSCKDCNECAELMDGLCQVCFGKRIDRLPQINIEDIPEKLVLEQGIRIVQSRIGGIAMEREALCHEEKNLVKLVACLRSFIDDLFIEGA